MPYCGTWDMTRPYTFGGQDTSLGVGNKPLPWYEAFRKAYTASKLPGDPTKLRHTEINLTHPEWSRVLQRHLARSAGGPADDATAVFSSKDDPRYREVLAALRAGRDALLAKPRMDMPGGVPVPQQRDFGRTF